MDYKNIIEEILLVYNLNASELASKIDVQRSSISHILSGRNKPSLEFLIKIKNSFPELHWDYILLGKRPMTSKEAEIIENKINERKEVENLNLRPTPMELDFGENTPEIAKKKSILDDIDSLTENSNNKKITKIVWFYDDHSFEVFENK